MSSQQRIDTSRANGAKSRAARLTHGLTSDELLIGDESEKEFNAFREEYLADYQPQTRTQVDLVDQLVATRWRLSRVISLQNRKCHQEPSDTKPPRPDKDRPAARTPPLSTIDHPPSTSSSTSAAAELQNQKCHQEPSDSKPPRPDKDRPAARTPPPSTIDHPPSTSSSTSAAAELQNQKCHQEPSDTKPPRPDKDGPAAETPPPSTIDHPPSTIHHRPARHTCGQRAASTNLVM